MVIDMLSAHTVADYFLAKVAIEEGELISNLKLQKLLYYAQGFHLALYGDSLFKENLEAWNHGPVVREIYNRFKEYGASPLPRPDDFDGQKYDDALSAFLDEVYDVYGQFSAWKLREMTHEETPWKDAYARNRGVISHDSMREYFKTQVVSQAN